MDIFTGFVLGFFALLFLVCLLDNTDEVIGDLEEQVDAKDAIIDSLTAERKVTRHRLAVTVCRRMGKKRGDVAPFQVYWPSLEDVPDGVDIFREKYGKPTGGNE